MDHLKVVAFSILLLATFNQAQNLNNDQPERIHLLKTFVAKPLRPNEFQNPEEITDYVKNLQSFIKFHGARYRKRNLIDFMNYGPEPYDFEAKDYLSNYDNNYE